MFVAIVLIIMAGVLVKMRNQLMALQRRVALLEGEETPAAVIARDRSAAMTVRDALNVAPVASHVIEPTPVVPAPEPAPVEPEPESIEPISMLVEPVPTISPVREPGQSARPRIGFEELFGRRLPIWAGGVTLAVAGMLIVKYSIDAGLVSPLVRVISGLLFGMALIGGAEAALRNQAKVRDIRVRQALAGAGIASLYASVLIAANLYHLIGPATAFVGLAGVTALAMGLAVRFGAPSALLGLVGGLAAPALIGSAEPNVPLLALYLAMAIGGLCTLSRGQRWAWLGVSALIGGFGWGVVLLLGGARDAAASISIGLFLMLLGIFLPMMLIPGKAVKFIRYASAAAAAAQMAALVATGGFSLLDWGLFGLISIAIMWLSGREASLVRLPAIGTAIALLLLGAWSDPSAGQFTLVALGLAAIYAVPVLLKLWHSGGLIDAVQIAGIAIGGVIVSALHFYEGGTDRGFALLSLAAALLPAGAAAVGWLVEARYRDARFALLVSAAALLVAAAAGFALPEWSMAPIVAAIGMGLLLLSLHAHDPRLEHSAWAFAGAGLLALSASDGGWREFARALGEVQTVDTTHALVRWAGLAAIAAGFAWQARGAIGRALAQATGALLAYGTMAQFVSPIWLPLVPALGLVGCALAARRLPADRLWPALATLLGVSLLWAAGPLLDWASAATLSLAGEPVLTSALPLLKTAMINLAVPAVSIAAAAFVSRHQIDRIARRTGFAAAGFLGVIAGHILYKQLFAIDTVAAFARHGLAERTIWEAILLAVGAAVWRFANRQAGIAVAAAALAHFTCYTLLLHNPLWSHQAVGSVPAMNWLVASYGLPLFALWLVGRHEPELSARFDHPRSIAQILLIPLLAVSLLRQLFVGTVLTVPGVSDAEDIMRSVLMVGLGVAFLLWGIARKSRDWRIASLVLMLGAAGKVFLFDASGLDGLARIGSFVALGFSLIGIGWLYSRYLTQDAPLTTAR